MRGERGKMLRLLSFSLVTALAAQVHAFVVYAPCFESVCATDAFTVSWTIDPTETFTALTADITYAGGSSTTRTIFNAMRITDSSTVLPASFMPGLQYGQTSTVDFGLYTGRSDGDWGVWYTGVSISSPAARTDTVTRTVTQTPVTVTASATESRTTSETDATPTPTPTDEADSDSEADSNSGDESSGLSTGAKAGIGVGVGAGVLLIVAAGAIWFIRRRRQMNEKWDSVPVIRGASDEPISEPEGQRNSFIPAISSSGADSPRVESVR
ncbi:hypothetical protein BJY01DRAFT_229912 [Aspergillus pseudoustus]|uniref:Mid2 domain-containing protein n=1 Tax=Aspergillus pseudoustus TaxID=1810923 RepID=A0ABR4IEW8_9EURO